MGTDPRRKPDPIRTKLEAGSTSVVLDRMESWLNEWMLDREGNTLDAGSRDIYTGNPDRERRRIPIGKVVTTDEGYMYISVGFPHVFRAPLIRVLAVFKFAVFKLKCFEYVVQ